MPTKKIVNDSNFLDSSKAPEVLNAIRNAAPASFQADVPALLADEAGNYALDDLREIGSIILNYEPHKNAFIDTLVNRIGRVLITSKMYENPIRMFKKGLLELGETIEEIFVTLIDPIQFDPEVAETNIFKRVIPDVRAAFHTMNSQIAYKITISNDQLRQAFLNWQGITDLIGRIIEQVYTSANYDEFLIMKYMVAKQTLKGNIAPTVIPNIAPENMKAIVSTVKGVSNSLTFMNANFNPAQVPTHTDKADQYILINSKFDAQMDVEVLASAFNMDRAQFIGNRVLIDDFGNFTAYDERRMAKLFEKDPTYVPLTTAQKQLMSNVPCIILDRDWFMVFDNYLNMTQQYNGEGLYWNYWYHKWNIYSVSPFAQATVFTTTTPTVTAVNVLPATASITKGGSYQFSATVTGTGFVSQSVIWAIDSSLSTVDSTGLVTVGANETSASLTVTATSAIDSTKSDTAVISTVNT